MSVVSLFTFSFRRARYFCRGGSTDSKSFLVLYRWPTMRHFRVLSRFKVYQAGVMLISLPPLCYWYYTGSVSTKSLITGLSAATGTVLVLCGLSYAFSRVLGELAYCKQTETVRLSYLTFLGRRRDLEMHSRELVPFHDSQTSKPGTSNVQKLETLSNGSFLYSLRYGHVYNRDLFHSVLGK